MTNLTRTTASLTKRIKLKSAIRFHVKQTRIIFTAYNILASSLQAYLYQPYQRIRPFCHLDNHIFLYVPLKFLHYPDLFVLFSVSIFLLPFEYKIVSIPCFRASVQVCLSKCVCPSVFAQATVPSATWWSKGNYVFIVFYNRINHASLFLDDDVLPIIWLCGYEQTLGQFARNSVLVSRDLTWSRGHS
jgi:hypothetical protein